MLAPCPHPDASVRRCQPLPPPPPLLVCLQGCLASIERMQGDLGGAGDKYAYIQKLRAYVADLCNMLQVGWRRRGGGEGALCVWPLRGEAVAAQDLRLLV